jgi:hypothetical protein
MPIEVDGPILEEPPNNEFERLVADLQDNLPKLPYDDEFVEGIAREYLKRQPETRQALAIGLAVANPDWSIEDIAEKVGCDRKTPYRWRSFMKVWDGLRAMKMADRDERIRRGSKYNQVLEAIDQSTKEDVSEDGE